MGIFTKNCVKSFTDNTALVHDWLISPIGGAEQVLQELYTLMPSPIYTLLWNPQAFLGHMLFNKATVIPSVLQRLPWSVRLFRTYLPLFPFAIEQFDLRSYDLIVSSSHCVAKGVLTHPDQIHICYCHTPMRYAWDLSYDYLQGAGFMKRWLLHHLRGWDVHSSHRVDHFIANSHFVKRRIRRAYGRDAQVIYPPVDTDFFQLGTNRKEFYLTVSRLVSYKKIDLVVEAFARMPHRTLIVIGDGPEMRRICKEATPNVQLLGVQPRSTVRMFYQEARALLFPGVEDFGIAPVEAMACGTPVLALRRGGCVESVVDQGTGLFFNEQTVHAICAAVDRFEQSTLWEPERIRKHALRFRKERFHEEIHMFLKKIT
jgi:glycosyltransferase involved in cell wall biosynthesis